MKRFLPLLLLSFAARGTELFVPDAFYARVPDRAAKEDLVSISVEGEAAEGPPGACALSVRSDEDDVRVVVEYAVAVSSGDAPCAVRLSCTVEPEAFAAVAPGLTDLAGRPTPEAAARLRPLLEAADPRLGEEMLLLERTKALFLATLEAPPRHALRDGDYAATFAIVDADGGVKWRSGAVAFSVPQKDKDGLRAVAYPVAQMTADVKLAPGAYRLRAYLDHGGYAAAFEKGFYVTARPSAADGDGTQSLPTGGPRSCAADAAFIDLGKVDEKQGADAMARVAAGATALVHLEKWGNIPPKFLPLKNLAIIPRSHWLYHDDTIMVPDALTAGLKTGFLDWDFYEGCFPLFGFTTETEPVSFASVNFNVGGPLVYNRSFNLATFRHGKGRLIVSTFPLDESSPAGAIILANVRR